MKKILLLILAALPSFFILPSCGGKPDYFAYVSEYRSHLFLLKEDGFEIKLTFSQKEHPVNLDGIKGETACTAELYYTSQKQINSVEARLLGVSGEMSYMSVSSCFYLSIPHEEVTDSSLEVVLKEDGTEKTYTLKNVSAEAAIDAKTALSYVVEYDRAEFDALTDGSSFNGEIIVRLIYDEGCYYYVGVCAGQGQIHAFLVDAANGRVLAERSN